MVGEENRWAYYARCQALYGTMQEVRDKAEIRRLGYRIVPFPPQADIDAEKRRMADIPHYNVMEAIFKPLVASAEILFFRSLPDGRIPSGVHREILWAQEAGKPVLELPSGILSRGMSLELTREYLREVGQR